MEARNWLRSICWWWCYFWFVTRPRASKDVEWRKATGSNPSTWRESPLQPIPWSLVACIWVGFITWLSSFWINCSSSSSTSGCIDSHSCIKGRLRKWHPCFASWFTGLDCSRLGCTWFQCIEDRRCTIFLGNLSALEGGRPSCDCCRGAKQADWHLACMNRRGKNLARHLHVFRCDKRYSWWNFLRFFKFCNVWLHCLALTDPQVVDSFQSSRINQTSGQLSDQLSRSELLYNLTVCLGWTPKMPFPWWQADFEGPLQATLFRSVFCSHIKEVTDWANSWFGEFWIAGTPKIGFPGQQADFGVPIPGDWPHNSFSFSTHQFLCTKLILIDDLIMIMSLQAYLGGDPSRPIRRSKLICLIDYLIMIMSLPSRQAHLGGDPSRPILRSNLILIDYLIMIMTLPSRQAHLGGDPSLTGASWFLVDGKVLLMI